MTSYPHVDHSDDIRAFRRMLENALSERRPDFEYEMNRLNGLLESKKLKTEQRKAVGSFIRMAEADVYCFQNYFIPRATFQYAINKKEVSTNAFKSFHSVVQPFDGTILTVDEAAHFIVHSGLGLRNILTALSHIFHDIKFLDNLLPHNQTDAEDLELLQVSTEEFIKKYENPMALRKEIAAFQNAFTNLEACIFGDFDAYTREAESLTLENLQSDQDCGLIGLSIFNYSGVVYSIHDELDREKYSRSEYVRIARQAFKEDLANAIAFAEKEGIINDEEGDVIKGDSEAFQESLGNAVDQENNPESEPVPSIIDIDLSEVEEQSPVEGEPNPDDNKPLTQKRNRLEYFPFMEDVIKDEEVISKITVVATNTGLLEDDPDMIAAFKYRFTGLEELKPKGDIVKIHWRINAMEHRKRIPGELFALLYGFSRASNGTTVDSFRENCRHILRFFAFQKKIDDGIYEAVDYQLPDNVIGRISGSDRFRKLLKLSFEGEKGILSCLNRAPKQ